MRGALDLRSIARALGGEVSGRQAIVPGPGHSPDDRSLAIKLSVGSPDGFIVFSHSRDDFQSCRDFVKAKLGMAPDTWKRRVCSDDCKSITTRPKPDDDDRRKRIVRAVEIWSEARAPAGTLVETYLASRGLTLPENSDALRFHARCLWQGPDGKLIRIPAMVAAMRTIDGVTITGVHRTRLTEAGEKVDRRMLGIASGVCIKIDSDDAVTHGLAIGEGIESCLAARQMGFRPTWALASAGGIAGFPVLSGVEALTLLGENDPTSDRAIMQCAERWHAAKREVTIATPNHGSDMNDVLRGVA